MRSAPTSSSQRGWGNCSWSCSSCSGHSSRSRPLVWSRGRRQRSAMRLAWAPGSGRDTPAPVNASASSGHNGRLSGASALSRVKFHQTRVTTGPRRADGELMNEMPAWAAWLTETSADWLASDTSRCSTGPDRSSSPDRSRIWSNASHCSTAWFHGVQSFFSKARRPLSQERTTRTRRCTSAAG